MPSAFATWAVLNKLGVGVSIYLNALADFFARHFSIILSLVFRQRPRIFAQIFEEFAPGTEFAFSAIDSSKNPDNNLNELNDFIKTSIQREGLQWIR